MMHLLVQAAVVLLYLLPVIAGGAAVLGLVQLALGAADHYLAVYAFELVEGAQQVEEFWWEVTEQWGWVQGEPGAELQLHHASWLPLLPAE